MTVHTLIFRISIHAFRVEGDKRSACSFDIVPHFNPRLPCGRRHYICSATYRRLKFQSTPSVWKATNYPHKLHCWLSISIHAFRVEGDQAEKLTVNTQPIFQSTPSVWKATAFVMFFRFFCISFQSTPSVWKATFWRCCLSTHTAISIHAFRVEGDQRTVSRNICRQLFQSTPSVWKATNVLADIDQFQSISIHAFRVEGDMILDDIQFMYDQISIHAFRVEGDKIS